jgi:hypothetical protein
MSPQDSENFRVKNFTEKKSYNKNAKMTLLKLISGLVTSLVFHGLFIQNYSETIN